MTLSRKIVAAVESSADPASCRRVEAGSGPSRVALSLQETGPVGLSFDRLDFARDLDAPLSAADLRGWGDRLASRLTYLMEPLVLLEVDAEAGEAELRSRQPSRRDDLRSYYDVRLGRAGTLRLQRVAFDDATRARHAVPCRMTVEALERLVDDLDGSLA